MRQFRGTIKRTIDHAQVSNPAIAHVLNDLLGHRARAQNQRGMSFEVAEDALRQLHTGERDGHRPRAHFRFAAHALADFQRSLEHAIEHRSRGAVIESLIVSGAQLPEDFGLA